MREGQIIEEGFWAGAEVISVYTRAQAIEDGVLVDVSEQAREAGFTVPVAVTRAVWSLVDPTEAETSYGQDVKGRLWDVLYMAHLAIKTARTDAELLLYRLIFQMRGRPDFRSGQRTVTLKIHSGPGDVGDHVLTIMLPEED